MRRVIVRKLGVTQWAFTGQCLDCPKLFDNFVRILFKIPTPVYAKRQS